ncbi:SCO family protein [Nereida ignava]|uniref:SCO family protein n=1 Tax=Nereida ignava TaxID=282199 RepID=UPI002FE11579
MQRRKLLGYGAVGAGLLGTLLFAGRWQVDGPGGVKQVGKRPLPLSDMVFQLTDHQGNAVGPDSLIGRPTMVFFGFTFCPDVCPTTLSDISGWLDDLGDEAEKLRVVFITIDPNRDTVEAMADYVRYFHPAVRGWTGTDAAIAQAAQGFRVTYEKVPSENGDYTMNHTSSVFLYDYKGRFVATIDYHEPREFAVPKIRRAMQNSTEEKT